MPYIKMTDEEENLNNEESRYSFLSLGLLWLICETLKLKYKKVMVKCESCGREVMEHDAICEEDGNWFCFKCVAEHHAELLKETQSAMMEFSKALNLAGDAFNRLTEAWKSLPYEVTGTIEEEAEQ